jgi:carbohydrate-selective porin OprB
MGSIVPTAATYGQFDLGISQAYIHQNFFDNRFQYTIGKIFAPNFIDAYPFFDDNRQFLSQAFSTSPTIASPLRGFGAVAAWYPTESGLYIKPGVFTFQSSDTGSTIDNFINTNERFYMMETGWSGLARSGVPIQARSAMDSDNRMVSRTAARE